jgi:hypothetical protein
MFRRQGKKLSARLIAIAVLMPGLALQASAIPTISFGPVGARDINMQNSNLFTEAKIYGSNQLLYLQHGYSYGGHGDFHCRQRDNDYNRSHRYCGGQDSQYKNYSWPYIGLGLGFFRELGKAQHRTKGADRHPK